VSPRAGEPSSDAFDRAGEGRAELAVALLRVALVPLVVLGETSVDHPGPDSDLFTPLVLLVGLWALGLLAAHGLAAAGRLPALPRLARIEPIVDLIALGALTYTSGGPYSEARLAFFALPLVAAFRLRPALTVAWTAAAIAVYVLISLPHPATRTGADVDAIVVHALFLAWAGAGAVVLSALLGERNRRLRALADERGRLVAQALTAEDRERQRLAELLHDDAIQNLLVARQELRDHHRRHDEDSYRRADEALAVTVDRLRGEIFELHPYVLDHAGLRAALTAHAESAARRAGARAVVEADDAGLTESQQELVLSLARELLSNAARHSGARTIRLRLACDAEAVVLVVADDGAGFAPERRSQALAQGHIGMATSAERAAAVGGTFDVASAPGAGTTITVRLPRDDRRAA
jgi:two-component system NarL family sensor kinase